MKVKNKDGDGYDLKGFDFATGREIGLENTLDNIIKHTHHKVVVTDLDGKATSFKVGEVSDKEDFTLLVKAYADDDEDEEVVAKKIPKNFSQKTTKSIKGTALKKRKDIREKATNKSRNNSNTNNVIPRPFKYCKYGF